MLANIWLCLCMCVCVSLSLSISLSLSLSLSLSFFFFFFLYIYIIFKPSTFFFPLPYFSLFSFLSIPLSHTYAYSTNTQSPITQKYTKPMSFSPSLSSILNLFSISLHIAAFYLCIHPPLCPPVVEFSYLHQDRALLW